MGSRGSGYENSNSVTSTDMKWLRKTTLDGNVAYVNPDNDNLVATANASGEINYINKEELEKFRKSHDMKTGSVKKEYIKDLAKQYTEVLKSGSTKEEIEDVKYSTLFELTQIARKMNPKIGNAVEWRNSVGTVINGPLMREVEKTLGINIL